MNSGITGACGVCGRYGSTEGTNSGTNSSTQNACAVFYTSCNAYGVQDTSLMNSITIDVTNLEASSLNRSSVIEESASNINKGHVAAMIERYEGLQGVHPSRQPLGRRIGQKQKTLGKISCDKSWCTRLGNNRRSFLPIVLVVVFRQGSVDLVQPQLMADAPFHSGCCEVSESQFFPATLVKAVTLPRGCVGSARAKTVEEGREPAVGVGRRPTRRKDPKGREKRGRVEAGVRIRDG